MRRFFPGRASITIGSRARLRRSKKCLAASHPACSSAFGMKRSLNNSTTSHSASGRDCAVELSSARRLLTQGSSNVKGTSNRGWIMKSDVGNLALTKDALVPILRQMLLIRRMEERLSADFHAGKLPGAVHLYIGQEAVAAGGI